MGNGIIKKLDNFYFMGMWESASIYDVLNLIRLDFH